MNDELETGFDPADLGKLFPNRHVLHFGEPLVPALVTTERPTVSVTARHVQFCTARTSAYHLAQIIDWADSAWRDIAGPGDLDENGRPTLRGSQALWAYAAGTTRPTANKVFQEMGRLGLIVTSRSKLKVIDFAGLRQYTDMPDSKVSLMHHAAPEAI